MKTSDPSWLRLRARLDRLPDKVYRETITRMIEWFER